MDIVFEEKFLTEFSQLIIDFEPLPKEETLGLVSIFGNIRHESSHSNVIYSLLRPNVFPWSQIYGASFLSLIGDVTGTDFTDEHIISIEREKLTINYRFIDINIITENFSIIIENKIDARDQESQLIDYLHDIEKISPDKTVLVIYLTITGRLPSKSSIPNEVIEKLKKDRRFGVLSYKKDIFRWLNELPAEKILRAEIDVYKEVIKEICGMTSEREAIDFGRKNFQKMKSIYVNNIRKSNICTEGLNYIRMITTNLEFLRVVVEDLKNKLNCEVKFFVSQLKAFTDYNSFEALVLSCDLPYGIGVDIDREYRIGLEYNPKSNLIDGNWYFGYMKGVKGTPSELNSHKELELAPCWKDGSYRVYPSSTYWGECVDVTKQVKDNVGVVEYSDCSAIVSAWFGNQIQFINQQKANYVKSVQLDVQI